MKTLIHGTFYLILMAGCLMVPAWGQIEDACTANSKDCLGAVIEADRAHLLVKGEGRLLFRRAPDDRPVLGAILHVGGFGLGRNETCDEDSGLTKPEKDWLVEKEDLWNLGFHIYSLDWCSPSDYIQRNSLVLEKALEVIRAGEMGDPKAPLADTAQLVVIGGSMGGLVTRHALARMEAERTPHGVSLFISFDAPQLGAYLPISVQYANQFILTSVDVAGLALFRFPPSLLIRLSDDPRALLLTGMDTPAARQMLLVHYSRFDGAGPHPDFTALQQEMTAYGFPSAFGMQRVAIANGMSGRTTRNLEGVVFETKRVTFKSASVDAKYKVGTRLLWEAVADLQFRVPLKLTLTPLTRGGVNQEVFRVDLSNAELRINGTRFLPARVPTLSDIANELGIPDWVPIDLLDNVLDPVLDRIDDFLDDSFLDVQNLGIRSRSNAPYAYEAGGAGLGEKYTAFRDALAELPFAELSGGDESETFIPTRSAIGVSGDPTLPISEADIAGSPFDRVYFHEEDTNHVAFTTEVDRWICKELHDLIRRPFLSRISPSKRPVAGSEFTVTVTGGNFNQSSVVTWNYQGKTDLATEFVDGGTLRAFVPDDLIAELTECVDENGCAPPSSVFGVPGGERADVTIRVENREALPLQTTSPDWEPTEAPRCVHSRPFQIEEVSLPTFTPEPPTSVDVIEAVFAQDWRDSCAPSNPQVEVQGLRIRVTAATPLTDPNQSCLFAVTPYTLNFSFGPLPAGDYTLEVRDVRTSFGRETVTPLATRVFSVRNPVPVARSLVPDTAPAGSPDLDLRVIGGGFVAGQSTAYWNGDPLLTTVESPNEIAAIVPAGRLRDQGPAQVIVRTNDPNQQLASGPLAFTIGPPELTLARLQPDSVPADSSDTTITLIGAGFGATTSVEWTRPGGSTSGLPVTIVDAQRLTVTLPASELRLPATHLFAVRRDADSSDSLGFMVTSAGAPTNFIPVVDAAVNAGSFNGPVAPGGLASLFGSALASGEAHAASFPLPVELLGTRVLVNGVEAPLLYVSDDQINFQVPFGTAPGDASFVIRRDGEAGPTASHSVAGAAFGAFQYQRAAPGLDPIVTHADGSLVTPASPARLGETVVLYGTGVGMLTNPPATGQPSPSEPLAVCAAAPRAFLSGGQFSEEASVAFCGLTPGFAGLVQINIRLPQTRPPGTGSNLGVLFPGGAIQSWPLPVVE